MPLILLKASKAYQNDPNPLSSVLSAGLCVAHTKRGETERYAGYYFVPDCTSLVSCVASGVQHLPERPWPSLRDTMRWAVPLWLKPRGEERRIVHQSRVILSLHLCASLIFLQAFNTYQNDPELLSAILCAGLYPSVAQVKRRGKRCAFFTREDGKVSIHPSSVNAFNHSLPHSWLLYSNKVKTSDIYLR